MRKKLKNVKLRVDHAVRIYRYGVYGYNARFSIKLWHMFLVFLSPSLSGFRGTNFLVQRLKVSFTRFVSLIAIEKIMYMVSIFSVLERLYHRRLSKQLSMFLLSRRWIDVLSSFDRKHIRNRFCWDIFERRKKNWSDWEHHTVEKRAEFKVPGDLKIWLFMIRATIYVLIFYWVTWFIFIYWLRIGVYPYIILGLFGNSVDCLVDTTVSLSISLLFYILAVFTCHWDLARRMLRLQKPFWVSGTIKRRERSGLYLCRLFVWYSRLDDWKKSETAIIRKR